MNDKLRVLQVGRIYWPSIGGVEQIMQALAEGLTDCAETEVLVASEQRGTIHELVNGIPVTRASNLKTVWRMPLAPSFVSIFKQMSQGKDLVQLHFPFPIGELAYLLSGYEGRVYVWWHGEIVRQRAVLPLYRPLINAMLDRVDGVMVASEQQINGSEFLAPRADKCHVIPFGIDLEEWCSIEPDQFLRKHLADPDAFVLLHVGRLSSPKGLTYLLRAMPELSGCELFLVGDGELRGELAALAESLEVLDRVHFMGLLCGDDLKRAYADCDVFVFPTIWDSFGLVQLEAMAYGKPVVNTSLASAVPTVSVSGETGITVPPSNTCALVEAIGALAGDASLRKRYGLSARRRVEDRYSLSRMLGNVKDIYLGR